MTAIERTTKLATTVDDLPAAWAFVMGCIDDVGPNPRVSVNPIWAYSMTDMDSDYEPPRRFEVCVSGMTEDGEGA